MKIAIKIQEGQIQLIYRNIFFTKKSASYYNRIYCRTNIYQVTNSIENLYIKNKRITKQKTNSSISSRKQFIVVHGGF